MAAHRLHFMLVCVWMRFATATAAETSAAAEIPVASQVSSSDPAQCQLLLAFRSTLANRDDVLRSWQNDSDCCAWIGVGCSTNGSIFRMALAELGITAIIPQPDGWALPSTLQVLELAGNNITGPIPAGWKLPPTLTYIYFDNNPLGGALSPNLTLPDTLERLLLRNCSLTGLLPSGRPLPPALQIVGLNNNRLLGTIPPEFTELPRLRGMELQNNLLTGPLPPRFTFDTSHSSLSLVLYNNSLSGRVPSWPQAASVQVDLFPGNEGLCGELPPSPRLSSATVPVGYVTSLPPCTTDTISGASRGKGTVVGTAVGAVAGALAVAIVGAVWTIRHRRALRTGQVGPDRTTGKLGSDMEQGSGGSTAPSKPPTRIAPQEMFNPFKLAGNVSNGDGGPPRPSQATPSRGSSKMPLTAAGALLRSKNDTCGSVRPPYLPDRLDELYSAPPAWLISPTCLMLEMGNDGRLVLLGEGSFGRVYRGWIQPKAEEEEERRPAGSGAHEIDKLPDSTGKEPVAVALKVMEVGHLSAFLKEADIMYRLSHNPHMVMLHGACIVGQQLVVVMELMEGGDLAKALLFDNDQALTWQQHGKQIALDIAAGLTYLHDNNITHRDLKSRNVLLTKDLRAKVSDVGTAAIHSATYLSAGSSNFMGTLAWAAPELLLGSPCTNQIDIYSMGVCLWEIVARQVPKRGCVAPPPVSDDCPAGLADLIHDCLQLDPKQRPTAQQVLERLQQL